MKIVTVGCPACSAHFVVDQSLHRIGDIRLRCPRCEHYFLPDDSPGDLTLEQATNASVEITLWEPDIKT